MHKKLVLKVVAFIGTIVLITGILSFLFIPSSYLRVVLHEVQSEDVNYDMIFFGQSLGETNINPYIVEEETGLTTYNLSRRIMTIPDLLYLVKESNYHNDLKYMVFHIDPVYWYGTDVDYYNDAYIYPHLNNPKNKIEYFLKYCLNTDYRVMFSRYVVQGMGDIRNCKVRLQQKLSAAYRNYSMDAVSNSGDYFEYVGRGFRYGVKYADNDYPGEKWSREFVDPAVLEGFRDIVNYCDENDIQIIAIASPFPEGRFTEEELIDFHNYYQEYLKQYQIDFLDFNFMKKEYFQWEESGFQDGEGHMMGELAEEYSQVLGRTLQEYLSGNDWKQYFNQSDRLQK